jgi:arylsulfatase A-like enzyme
LDEYLLQYYAMVTQLDANIGRMLDVLDKLGIADNTVVIFTSDHGDMQGSHGAVNKGLPWEESSRIPLIVRAPNGVSGQVIDDLVSGVDYFPTCLDYAGCPTEPSAEGNSFATLTTNEDAQPLSRTIYSEMQPWCMVRESDYKLVADKEPFVLTHLFNLSNDPYELTNLLDDEAVAAVQQDLRSKLESWFARVTA